jgi:hypothetical protein
MIPKKFLFLFIPICLLLLILINGFLDSDKGITVVMSMEEFINDYQSSIDNDTKKIMGGYDSLDNGDTVIIRDTIRSLTYNESNNYTLIEFASFDAAISPIEGNLINSYNEGDVIELTLHIVLDTFTVPLPPDEIWVYNLEVMKEGWDKDSHQPVPVPQRHLRRVSF